MNRTEAAGEDAPADVWQSFARHRAYIVGIDRYGNGITPLKTAAADARRLAEVLAEAQGFDVHPPLLDEEASAAGLRQLLRTTMPAELGKDDRAIFYFAGHGVALDDKKGPAGFLVPSDAVPGQGDSMLPMSEVMQALDALPCRHLLVVLDCCFSGFFRWASQQREMVDVPKCIYQERFARFVSDRAWQVITSSAHDQKALDVLDQRALGARDAEGEHSPFALALFDALQGAADTCHPGETQGDGIITATELYLYLREAVEPATQALGRGLRQTPSFFPLPRSDKGEFIFLHPRHALTLPRMDPGASPYKGLKSFDAGDANLFYGRERVIAQLLKLAEEPERRLIVVTGASGSGKSSLVKAGLLPLLKKTRPELNLLPTMRPGEDPSGTLKQALAGAPPNSVLVIDQLEEVITRGRDGGQASLRDFDTELGALLAPGSRVRHLIVTVRSDFEPQFSRGRQLGPHWAAGRYPVPAFSTAELREVILMPAVQATMVFDDPTLVDRIVDEVAQSPGALPLLSFVLNEMFNRYLGRQEQGRVLKRSDYEDLGGVIGAMTQQADRLYASLPEPEQALMQRIMLRMVSLEGELAGRRVAVEDLHAATEEAARVDEVVAKLVDARLVVQQGNGQQSRFVEPAHDALVRAWPALHRWIAAFGHARLSLAAQLAAAAAEEAGAKVKDGLLWNASPNLATVEGQWRSDRQKNTPWFNLREQSFIRRSAALKKRRQRVGIGITIGVLLAMGAATVVALRERDAAELAAEEALARSLAASAEAELATHPDRAVLLALESMKRRALPGTLAVVPGAITSAPYRVALQLRSADADVEMSPDSRTLLTTGSKEGMGLWDAVLGAARPLQPQAGEPAFVNGPEVEASFSDDGRLLLSHGPDGVMRLWEAATGRQMLSFARADDGIEWAYLSPDGRSVLSRGKKLARLWDVATGQVRKTFPSDAGPVVISAWLRKGAAALLCAGRQCTVWDIAGDRPLLTMDTGVDLSKSGPWRVSANDAWLALVDGESKRIALLDLRSGQRMSAPGSGGGWLSPREPIPGSDTLWMSPDSAHLVALETPAGPSYEPAPWLYGLPPGPPRKLADQEVQPTQVAFSPDGQLLVTADDDGNLFLHDLTGGGATKTVRDGSGAAKSIAFSPDGRLFVVVDDSGTARVMDRKGTSLQTLRDEDGPLRDAIFSPDGKSLVTSGSAIRIWPRGEIEATRKLPLGLGAGEVFERAVMSADARFLAVASAGRITAFDLAPLLGQDLQAGLPRPVQTPPTGLNNLLGMALSTDEQRLLLEGSPRPLAWDIRRSDAGLELRERAEARAAIDGTGEPLDGRVTAFSADGRSIVTKDINDDSATWPLETARPWLWRVGAALSRDGKALLATNVPGSFLYFARKENPALRIGDGEAIFAPDGKTVATVDAGKAQVRLLDAATGAEKATMAVRVNNDKNAPNLHFSPNGELLLISPNDRQVQVFDTASGVRLREVTAEAGTRIKQARLSADGSRIVLLQDDNAVRIVACPECRPVQRLLAEAGKRIGRELTDAERSTYGLAPPATGGAAADKPFWRRWWP